MARAVKQLALALHLLIAKTAQMPQAKMHTMTAAGHAGARPAPLWAAVHQRTAMDRPTSRSICLRVASATRSNLRTLRAYALGLPIFQLSRWLEVISSRGF